MSRSIARQQAACNGHATLGLPTVCLSSRTLQNCCIAHWLPAAIVAKSRWVEKLPVRILKMLGTKTQLYSGMTMLLLLAHGYPCKLQMYVAMDNTPYGLNACMLHEFCHRFDWIEQASELHWLSTFTTLHQSLHAQHLARISSGQLQSLNDHEPAWSQLFVITECVLVSCLQLFIGCLVARLHIELMRGLSDCHQMIWHSQWTWAATVTVTNHVASWSCRCIAVVLGRGAH